MSGSRQILILTAACLLLAGWAHSAESQIGLAAWGTLRTGSALGMTGLVLIVTGLRRQAVDRWFPRPIHTGFSLAVFGVSMIAASRAGLWLVAPATAAGAVALSLGCRANRQPLLPAGDAAAPSLEERVRFWFVAALPWAALYVFTAQMRLPGRAIKFAFEDRMPSFPAALSLPYELMYAAVAAAPFLATTRGQLRKLVLSVWISAAVVFPFYWLVPTSGPSAAVPGADPFSRLLAYQHREFALTAALPSFHVLWAIFVGQLIRSRWARWAFVFTVAASCIASRMHYLPDVLAALALSSFFVDPEARLWQPLLRAGRWAGLSKEQVAWTLVYGFVSLIVFGIRSRSAAWPLAAGVGLMGMGLARMTWNGRRDRPQWPPAMVALAGAAVTALG